MYTRWPDSLLGHAHELTGGLGCLSCGGEGDGVTHVSIRVHVDQDGTNVRLKDSEHVKINHTNRINSTKSWLAHEKGMCRLNAQHAQVESWIHQCTACTGGAMDSSMHSMHRWSHGFIHVSSIAYCLTSNSAKSKHRTTSTLVHSRTKKAELNHVHD